MLVGIAPTLCGGTGRYLACDVTEVKHPDPRTIRIIIMEEKFTTCLKCRNGVLLPLSDYGRDGAPIQYKAWVCNNPDCGFNIRIDNGEISLGRDISTSVK
jgi:hypothetical protein